MTVLHSNLAAAWTPEDHGKAIDLVLTTLRRAGSRGR